MKWQRNNPLAATLTIALILLASALIVRAQNVTQTPVPETASQSWQQLLAASQNYRQSLARIAELHQQEAARTAELVARQKMLLAQGAISKRDLEAGEQAHNAAAAKLHETRQQLAEVDQLIAEASATEQLTRMPANAPRHFLLRERKHLSAEAPGNTRSILVRYAGTSAWDLRDFGQVEVFFRTQFGKPLTVSAYGQSATHNRLGFDHRAAIDVAVHPDSHEGQRLTAYLREHGIPFIAIRCAIPGSATGAHIHIGPPSKRSLAP